MGHFFNSLLEQRALKMNRVRFILSGHKLLQGFKSPEHDLPPN